MLRATKVKMASRLLGKQESGIRAPVVAQPHT